RVRPQHRSRRGGDVRVAVGGACRAEHPRAGPRPGGLPLMITTESQTFARTRLFLVSSLALTMAGIGASLRANTATDLQRVFFDPIDTAHSAEMTASILGLPFLGFALTIAIGSPLLDYVGMGLLLPLSGVCFAVGALAMVFA